MKLYDQNGDECQMTVQGLFELGKPETLNVEQTDLIKRHLAMVFAHEIDPSYPKQQIPALDSLHGKPDPPKIGGTGPDGTVFRC